MTATTALRELRDRLVQDDAELRAMAKTLPSADYAEAARLKGEAQGVRLAMSKLDEVIRALDTERTEARGRVREALVTGLGPDLGDALYCSRTWDAWNVGTMTEEDFATWPDDDEAVDRLTTRVMRAVDGYSGDEDGRG